MENKINIAEILKDCSKGTKLYSSLFGNVELYSVSENNIQVRISKGRTYEYFNFTSEGLYYFGYYDAEKILFPSSEMRDWTKFFKRGDVVYNKDGGLYAIFEGWVNDDYTEFNTTINYYESITSFGTEEVCYTDCFVKASDEERAVFIANAEKYYNGKYNPDTLQVEPVKPKCPFKPFGKVLVRNNDQQIWKAAFFSHCDTSRDSHNYVTIPGFAYNWCIPYEGNEHLLGTTDPYTEGGSE